MKSFSVKLLLVILLTSVFSTVSKSQENCVWTNTSANAALRLRLGMTPAEANAALGGKPKIKNKTRGDYRFFQNYIDGKPPAKLKNVRALFLRFFNGQLYQSEIFYEETVSPSLDNFNSIVAQQYNFPLAAFSLEKTKTVVRCGEKTLTTDYALNPRIELTDEIILKKVLDEKKD